MIAPTPPPSKAKALKQNHFFFTAFDLFPSKLYLAIFNIGLPPEEVNCPAAYSSSL